MRELIKATKALSDETRLRILNLLCERECCVCEVMQALAISQTRASRNLKILCDAGFLKLRKDGLWAYYSLDEDVTRSYRLKLINAAIEVLKDDVRAALDRERLKNDSRTGCAREVTS